MSWSSAPPTNMPARAKPANGAWTSAANIERRPGHGAWLSSLEKVARFNGGGFLTVTLEAINRPENTQFGGDGAFLPSLLGLHPRLAVLSGEGFFTASAGVLRSDVTAGFAGGGRLEAFPNDGLSAIMYGQYPVYFSGGGGLDADTSGGVTVVDGLTATVLQRYLTTGLF